MPKLLQGLIILFILTTVPFLSVQAQEQNLCTQTLKDAQRVYDEGRISEVPVMLDSCLQDGFTRNEKIQAYRLLILSYLFDDEYEKAEQNLLLLLKLDPEYKPNTAIDPIEFTHLYDTYRTLPLYNIGIKGGMNITQIYQLVPYSVDNPENATGEYSSLLGYQFGVTADILLKNKFQLSVDLMYVGKKLEYESIILQYSRLNYTETQSWLELPVLVKYTFGQKKLRPYLQGGIGAGLLFSSRANVIRTDKTSGTTHATGPDIDTKELRKTLVYNLIGGAGLRYKLGYGYVVFDARYSMGLKNVADAEDRYSNKELVYKYGYLSDNFTMNNIIVSLGYYKSFYKPKKVKTNVE